MRASTPPLWPGAMGAAGALLLDPDVLALIADGTVDPLPVYSDTVELRRRSDRLAQGLRKPLVVRDGY